MIILETYIIFISSDIHDYLLLLFINDFAGAAQIRRVGRDENNQAEYFVTFLTYEEEEGEVRLTKDRIRQGVGNHNFFLPNLKNLFKKFTYLRFILIRIQSNAGNLNPDRARSGSTALMIINVVLKLPEPRIPTGSVLT